MLYRKLFDLQLLLILSLAALGRQFVSGEERVRRLATPSFSVDVYEKLAKYVVSIRSRTPRTFFGDNHFCGGSIVSLTYVLTSAKCVMDKRKVVHRSRLILIVAGTPNRLKIVHRQTLNMPAKKIFVPENYTVHNTNNIALIKLKHKLPSDNRHIGVLNLPRGPPTSGILYKVMGWGRLYKGGVLASRILFVDVMLQERVICERLLHPFMPEMMCAGNLNSTLDEEPCPGDAGSPLMVNLTVYGVTSYPVGCGHSQLPSIYTDVWYHMKWIDEIMNSNGCRIYNPPPVYFFALVLLYVRGNHNLI
ncbi:trypsin zeta-like [Drosophila montana]|uniref:trypsin zeta-like n=1 Tax=Drosophila montana TaxID=40370 RepID=UPI00313E4414